MGIIKKIKGQAPQLGENNWLAETAVVVGQVKSGKDCTFWFHSVVRGDVNTIELGDKVNVQDAAILHVSYEKARLIIGSNVSIGHRAIVHGCTIKDNVLIGMGATVMDHSVIGENSIVAAGAVILENTEVEPNSIYAGVPAKKVKDLSLIHI